MSNGPKKSERLAAPPPPQYAGFLTVFPSLTLPMFLAIVDQTIVATALPAIAASTGAVERGVLDRGRLSDRSNHRGADLRPAWRCLRPPQTDVRCARRVHGGVAGLRRRADHRVVDVGARAAGPRRRRADDAVAGVDRRIDPAARARPLPGLYRDRGGHRQFVRAGGRRLSDPAFRLAVDLPDQRADRAFGGRGLPRGCRGQAESRISNGAPTLTACCCSR